MTSSVVSEMPINSNFPGPSLSTTSNFKACTSSGMELKSILVSNVGLLLLLSIHSVSPTLTQSVCFFVYTRQMGSLLLHMSMFARCMHLMQRLSPWVLPCWGLILRYGSWLCAPSLEPRWRASRLVGGDGALNVWRRRREELLSKAIIVREPSAAGDDVGLAHESVSRLRLRIPEKPLATRTLGLKEYVRTDSRRRARGADIDVGDDVPDFVASGILALCSRSCHLRVARAEVARGLRADTKVLSP